MRIETKVIILASKPKAPIVLATLLPMGLLLIADIAIGDLYLFVLINRGMVHPVLDFACVYLAPVLFAVFYVLTSTGLYLSAESASTVTGILSATNGALSYAIGSLIKQLVMRPRPEVAARVMNEARIVGFWHTSTFSFPSTTTMLAFGLAFPILLQKQRAGTILVALSYLVGFAVIYTGFHFPLDVAAGAFLALPGTLGTNLLEGPLVNFISRYRFKELWRHLQWRRTVRYLPCVSNV